MAALLFVFASLCHGASRNTVNAVHLTHEFEIAESVPDTCKDIVRYAALLRHRLCIIASSAVHQLLHHLLPVLSIIIFFIY
jgi:hypothetical protein